MASELTDAEHRAIATSFLAPPGRLADWRLLLAYETAAEAGIFDALPGTGSDLAAHCALDAGALRAVLAMLQAWQVLDERDDGTLGPGSRWPGPAEHVGLLRHAAVLRRWTEALGPRLRDHAAGPPPRPSVPVAVGADPLALAARHSSAAVLDACLRRAPHARQALDLGGGHGVHALALARRGLRVTVQDRAAVLEHADADGRLSAAGVELFAGDLTASLPPGPFDLVLCATVTNMLDEASNRDLLRRVRAVLAPDGVLAIASHLRERGPVGASFALQMLTYTDGGDAYGAADYRAWFADAGYGEVEVDHLHDPPLSVITASRL